MDYYEYEGEPMLAILLTILKIIGIVLLCLLVTILVLAGLVLFVPIRYKASGFYRDRYSVRGSLSWLCHVISVKVSLQTDASLQMVIRVLGIPVYDMQKNKDKVSRKEKKSKAKEPEKEFGETTTARPPVPHRPGVEEQLKDTQMPTSLVEDSIRLSDAEQVEESVPPKLSWFDRLRGLWGKVKERVQNIRYTIRKICDKIKKIKDNITYYLDLFQEENTKLALQACKKELLRIWKDIKPKRFRVNALLGMDDPATTGQVLAYCAMLYPLHQGNLVVVPDFEQKVLEADFLLKGKITVYVYLVVAYTVLFNKNIKHFKKCLLREDS